MIISCKDPIISYKCTPQKSNITENSHVLKIFKGSYLFQTIDSPRTWVTSHSIPPPNSFGAAGTRNGSLISVQNHCGGKTITLGIHVSFQGFCHEFLQGGGFLSESHGKTDIQTQPTAQACATGLASLRVVLGDS